MFHGTSRPDHIGEPIRRLNSADPHEHPVVDLRFCEDERDTKRLVGCFRDALAFTRTAPLADLIEQVTFPRSGAELDDATIAGLCQRRAGSGYHPSGTVKMGPASDALPLPINTDVVMRLHNWYRRRIDHAGSTAREYDLTVSCRRKIGEHCGRVPVVRLIGDRMAASLRFMCTYRRHGCAARRRYETARASHGTATKARREIDGTDTRLRPASSTSIHTRRRLPASSRYGVKLAQGVTTVVAVIVGSARYQRIISRCAAASGGISQAPSAPLRICRDICGGAERKPASQHHVDRPTRCGR